MDKYNYIALIVRNEQFSESETNWLSSHYRQIGREAIYSVLKQKNVLPFGAKTYVTIGVDVEYWNKVLKEYKERNNKVLAFVNDAYTHINKIGVNKIFVSENLGSLLATDKDIALFSSGDVDNFAPYTEYAKIKDAMLEIGCNVKDIYTGNNHVASKFYVPKNYGLPDKFYFGLDFYPLARKGLPSFIEADKFIDWESCHKYKNTNINLASDTCLAYICIQHTSLHRFCQSPDLRLYFDLLNIFSLNIDYDKITEWNLLFKTQCRTAVATQLSNNLMNTSFPKSVTSNMRANRVIDMVYDLQLNDLKYNPNSINVIKIEVACNDHSDFIGLKEILFPDPKWVKKTYGNHKLSGYIKHILQRK